MADEESRTVAIFSNIIWCRYYAAVLRSGSSALARRSQLLFAVARDLNDPFAGHPPSPPFEGRWQP